jgi:predicted glycoside hydrolase/deacetylase ChbG (UPF0249 family)
MSVASLPALVGNSPPLLGSKLQAAKRPPLGLHGLSSGLKSEGLKSVPVHESFQKAYPPGTVRASCKETYFRQPLALQSGHAHLHELADDLRVARNRARIREGFPVVIHADDFGETLSITNGIGSGIEAGVLTSTSIMANMPATDYALQRARALAGQASFGVHLNLCEGRPLTSGNTLRSEHGEFHPKRMLIRRALSGKLSLRELESEIAAQIALIRDGGVPISHVDGHKHLHQLPMVSTAVANVLPRFGIKRVRITRVKSLAALGKRATLFRELAAWRAARVFRRAALHSPIRTVDLKEILENRFGPRAPQQLVDVRGTVELCCHPELPTAAQASKPSSHNRSAELEYLLSPRFRDLLEQAQARPVSYWEVG